ncbi:unnamed protein product [Trichogramma brassicae]|uniref:Uncharacterized protein n=1 Tax=Trichogramma brassicae TaxID=86971 RepID=A0A6H5IWZ8_9HYME|nr:unnamed protein product [Trichogramma brassicae]
MFYIYNKILRGMPMCTLYNVYSFSLSPTAAAAATTAAKMTHAREVTVYMRHYNNTLTRAPSRIYIQEVQRRSFVFIVMGPTLYSRIRCLSKSFSILLFSFARADKPIGRGLMNIYRLDDPLRLRRSQQEREGSRTYKYRLLSITLTKISIRIHTRSSHDRDVCIGPRTTVYRTIDPIERDDIDQLWINGRKHCLFLARSRRQPIVYIGERFGSTSRKSLGSSGFSHFYFEADAAAAAASILGIDYRSAVSSDLSLARSCQTEKPRVKSFRAGFCIRVRRRRRLRGADAEPEASRSEEKLLLLSRARGTELLGDIRLKPHFSITALCSLAVSGQKVRISRARRSRGTQLKNSNSTAATVVAAVAVAVPFYAVYYIKPSEFFGPVCCDYIYQSQL